MIQNYRNDHVVEMFLDENFYVDVIDDLSTGKLSNLPDHENLDFNKIDIRDTSRLFKCFNSKSPDIVIHLAAAHFIPWCNDHPVETTEINLMGTRNILNACRSINPELLFFASTAAVYPINDEKNMEDDEVGPMDIYGITKVMGEDLCKLLYFETEVDVAVGRLFNIYGPRETNPHVIPEIVEQLNNNNTTIELGNIEPKRDFIFVDDVARAILMICKGFDDGFEIFNIGTGEEYSIKELVDIFELIIGRKINISQSRKRMRKSERMHLVADIERIEQTIGWAPKVNIREGLEGLLK